MSAENALQSNCMYLDNNLFYTLPSTGYFPGTDRKPEAAHSEAETYAVNGLTAFQCQAYDQAVQIYTDAIRNFPEQPFFYACRSLVLQVLNDEEGAFYDYQIAKRLDFNYHIYLEWKENEGEMVEAAELHELDADIMQDPLNIQAYINRALILVQHFCYEAAIADYTMALTLAPENTLLFINRSAIYTRMLRYNLAMEDLNEAIAQNAALATAYLYRGKLNAALRFYEQAQADYARGLSSDPANVNIYEERAQFYESQQKWQEAIADYSKLISLNPDDFFIYASRADVYERCGDLQAALLDYNKAIELNPYYPDLYQYRAAVKERVGDQEGALADIAKYTELEDE